MFKKIVSFVSCLVLITSAIVINATAEANAYLVEDFESYADTNALSAVWKTSNSSKCSVSLSTENGKGAKFSYTDWADLYRTVDFKNLPTDVGAVKIVVTSENAVENLTLKLGYGNGAQYRYNHPYSLAKGKNEITINLEDDKWQGVKGWGAIGEMKPYTAIAQFMLSAGGGTNTLCFDEVSFVKKVSNSIDDFESYADTDSMKKVWGLTNPNASQTELLSDNGKGASFSYTNWADLYRTVDFKSMPTDAKGIIIKVNSKNAVSNLTLKLGYGNGVAYRYNLAYSVKAGDNTIVLDFDDSNWKFVKGWAATGEMKPISNVTQLMLSAGGGTNTLRFDEVLFATEKDLHSDEDPQKPEMPTDPYILDNFDQYANSASLGYDDLWHNYSGGTCTAELKVEPREGTNGKNMIITATNGGWMTITRNSIKVPADATSLSFWAKADSAFKLKLEYRLNNNSYKYNPLEEISIGTEWTKYTLYFSDAKFQAGSGTDKGWKNDDGCLVNAINFIRVGYEPLTLRLDDMIFGKEIKPIDPNDPLVVLKNKIEELPSADNISINDVTQIKEVESLYKALSSDQKKSIDNRQKLLDEIELVENWENILGDKLESAVALGNDIAKLPEKVEDADKETVKELWDKLSLYTEDQQELIPGYNKVNEFYKSLYGTNDNKEESNNSQNEQNNLQDSIPKTSNKVPMVVFIALVISGALIVALKKRKAC